MNDTQRLNEEKTCENCRFCGTSAADPPCRECSISKPIKWEPKPKPNMIGTWWVNAEHPAWWYGPVQSIDDNGDLRTSGSNIGRGCCLTETRICNGQYLPIPPKPPLGLELTGEVRVPTDGERYVTPAGDVFRCFPLGNDPEGFGWRRWILKKKVAEPSCPAIALPVKMEFDRRIGLYRIVSRSGSWVCNGCTEAKANEIARALNAMPLLNEVLGWMERDNELIRRLRDAKENKTR